MSAVTPASAPIADLSYRGYDGPLRKHLFPWLTIARMMIVLSLKRKVLWVIAFFACLPWLFSGFFAYLVSRMDAQDFQMPNTPTLGQLFYQAYAGPNAEFWVFLAAILIGAGSIANDVKANALQIYFSKPIRKADYLFGKWLGYFVVLSLLVLVPSLLLYLYCLGSFWNKPLLTDEPYLWRGILVTGALLAAFHAGGIIGLSACLKRSTMAGGIYAAAYVGLGVATLIASAFFRGDDYAQLRMTIFYSSPGGALDGLAQHIYNARPVILGFIPLPPEIPAPMVWPLAIVVGVVPILGLVVAHWKIRAVEVVQG